MQISFEGRFLICKEIFSSKVVKRNLLQLEKITELWIFSLEQSNSGEWLYLYNLGGLGNFVQLHDVEHLEQRAFDRSMPTLVKMSVTPMGYRLAF